MSVRRLAFVIVAFAAALVSLKPALAARAQHHPPTGSTRIAGQYDYYLLALSWSPVYCASHADDHAQCGGNKRFGLVLHGLWPQLTTGRPVAECVGGGNLDGEAEAFGTTIFPSPTLVMHEWNKHGTCTGLSAMDFFKAADTARRSVAVPPMLEPGAKTLNLPAPEIVKAVRALNPKIGDKGMVVTCSGPELAEIRVCLDRELQPRACGAGVASNCRPGNIRIPGAR
jgi:ribonuclease T2